MTLGDYFSVSDGHERVLTRFLQSILAGMMGIGVVTFKLGMVANGAFALGLTLLPAALRREYGYVMNPGLVLWITAAVFLHSVGALGPYSWFSWYDEITHTLSATIIAGFGYAAFRAFERHSAALDVGSRFRFVFVVVFVLAASVVWELLEFASVLLADAVGADPPLSVYGIDDIVTDMIFNTIGAVIVAAAGTEHFAKLAGFFRRRLGTSRPPDG
ncbi:hypothetical protein [Halobellus sp. GM3]|uniref:hypothetical protein n=1 Tax=Halobellus sp. GM3 TaxID=3458410 RepID=UPI00403DCDB4